MNIDDKVQFTKVIREHWVLKAKTGQNGVLKFIDGDLVKVQISNGEIVETKFANIKPYVKKEKFNLRTATNEELIDKFEILIAHQWQTKNTKTKYFEKLSKDIVIIREEILRRLSQ